MIRLTEKSRNELMSKSKNERQGLQRYKRRVKSHIASNVKQYNRINMDQLFRKDILSVNIEVKGETDSYLVGLSFGNVLDTLRTALNREDKQLELRDIIRAIVMSFNSQDVYVKCSCPDFKYRFAAWSTINKYKDGEAELRPSNVTNPDDKLGSACKHVLLVLANTAWIIKVASVIKNYIQYMEKHRESQYASVIYPAIYGRQYGQSVQQSFLDTPEDELQSEQSTLDAANIESRERGRFKSANPYRYTKPSVSRDQLSIDNIEGDEG